MKDPGEGLIIWAFATFHASAFVLVILFFAYRGGGVGQALQGLNTAVGLGLFVALWATTYISTRRAFRGFGLERASRVDGLVGHAMQWGAVNGAMFLLVLALATGGYFLVLATPFALIVGAIVGILFAGVDLILLGIATRLARRIEA